MMTKQDLVAIARDAAGRAYAPYSRFNVGCAIESIDGEVVVGANVENACYRLGICAEQAALAAAQQRFGLAKIARVAVAGGDGDRPCTPCGGCRQAIFEASELAERDIEILCAGGVGPACEHHFISKLLPAGFGPANLEG